MSTVIQASGAMDLEAAAVAREDHKASDRELIGRLVDQARADGVELVGENGLLGRAERAAADAALAEEIRHIHGEFDGTYGSPRVTAELRARGRGVNHKRVARVMRRCGIVGLHLRKKVRTTVPEPSRQKVPDLIRRDFTAPAPKEKTQPAAA